VEIISHRGNLDGTDKSENTTESFEKCFSRGFGIETDVRDYSGKLVLSHDIGSIDSPEVNELFYILRKYPKQYIALNIKADGIGVLLRDLLNHNKISNYFAFDMSIPQMLEYRNMGIKYLTRQSELEKSPVLYEDAAGVWLDAFQDDSWIDENTIKNHLMNGKKVCIVSPELHKRRFLEFWYRIKSYKTNDIMICTDYPIKANDLFNTVENEL